MSHRSLKSIKLAANAIALIWIVSVQSQAAPVTVRIGYSSSLPSAAPLAVVVKSGWAQEAGLELKTVRYNFPTAMLQAAQGDNLDVLLNSPGVLLNGREKKIDVRIVAGMSNESLHLVAVGSFAQFAGRLSGADALRAYYQKTGRKVRLASLDRGTLSDAVLQNWLKQTGTTDAVQLIHAGLDQIQQMLASEAVDGGITYQLNILLAAKRGRPYHLLANGHALLPGMPLIVVGVREEFGRRHPVAMQHLIQLFDRAMGQIRMQPEEAARAYLALMGGALAPLSVVAQALKDEASQFVMDPEPLIPAIRRLHDLLLTAGGIRKPVDLDSLFDLSYYQQRSAGSRP